MAIVPSGKQSSGSRASEMTRLLCAGARLDAGFGRKVIATLLDDRERLAAPAYGYDAVPVLAHALDARRAHWGRTAATALSAMLIAVFVATGLLGVLPGIMLCLWAAWTSIIVERVMSLQVLVTYLRSPNAQGGTFDGGYPQSDRLSRSTVEEITVEQDTTHGLVYYGGYEPFVGAGVRLRQWQIPVLLERVGADGARVPDAPWDVGQHAGEWFTVDEVTEYLEKRLPAVLATDAVGDQRIERLDVTRRWYRKAVSGQRPRLSGIGRPDVPQRTSGPCLYDLAREYLCVRVGSWEDELVTSVFISFDVKGQVLYTELYSYVLPPIQPRFRLVDRLPTTLDGGVVGRVAWHAAKSVFSDLLGLPMALAGRLFKARHRISTGTPFEPDDLTRYAETANDHGARESIRELAAIPSYRHFFQEVDAEKYTTIVERRLLDLLADFLTEKGLDTGELRERQTTVLNYGIIHHGSGSVVNTGTQAMGPHSKATSVPPETT